ncbi:LETM1-domain-containing protein [Basidiobolus meristosporus CBS 931.73]|uniref:LETM1-domain-containing protein n=1 Tax=Basidiobolus meristosporus CBS 931.73 TaxID=1314790 RepID=A0A1Y1XZE0_9FUNG|nr:LETM1-domain-containing protein [Basidiobolus meristosporus CBS 931.73]|eukprot:ORX91120.1 LETM1-domain-containing protein [Basidiobolus meristosporus CBS 931.73]
MYAIVRSTSAGPSQVTRFIARAVNTHRNFGVLSRASFVNGIGGGRFARPPTYSAVRCFTKGSQDLFGAPRDLRLLRSFEQPKVVTEAAKEVLKKETEAASKVAAEAPKKKSLWAKVKAEAVHYWHGTKLLGVEIKISTKLLTKMVSGFSLTRREQRQLQRTSKDLTRLIPFIIFLIVPFMELLLPVALKLFPNMLPSTYESKSQAEEKRKRLIRVRMEMGKYLRETVQETAAASSHPEAAQQFGELFKKVRKTGEPATTEEVLKVAKLLEDELTMENLSRPQLVSMCRFLGISSFGTDNFLRYQLRNKMRYLKADDRMIYAEGVFSLSNEELQAACLARGIRTLGLSPERMRYELNQWLDLHLRHRIPSSILILSRAFSISDQVPGWTPDALQATLSSLPETLVNETELNVSEAQGSADPKQKLEVITEQEEIIADELKEREKEAAEKRRKQEELSKMNEHKSEEKKQAETQA